MITRFLLFDQKRFWEIFSSSLILLYHTSVHLSIPFLEFFYLFFQISVINRVWRRVNVIFTDFSSIIYIILQILVTDSANIFRREFRWKIGSIEEKWLGVRGSDTPLMRAVAVRGRVKVPPHGTNVINAQKIILTDGERNGGKCTRLARARGSSQNS